MTPGPKRTLGPIVTSAESLVSADSQTVSGSVMRDAGRHRGGAQALLHSALGGGQLGARVDALELRLLAFDGDGAMARGAGDADGIGEIELALDVVVADRAQQLGDQRAVEAHHAGIDRNRSPSPRRRRPCSRRSSPARRRCTISRP